MPTDRTEPLPPYPAPYHLSIRSAAGSAGPIRVEKNERAEMVFSPIDTTTPEPPPAGEYGEGWPEVPSDARPLTLTAGNHNRLDFGDATIIDGQTFDGQGGTYALSLKDCKGTLYLRNCTFKNCKQGLAVSNPEKEYHAPTVYVIECNFEDCYKHEEYVAGKQPFAQVGIYYHDPMPRDGNQPTIGMWGNRFINCGIGSGDPAIRAKYARQFHHGVYIKGNPQILGADNLFVDYSSQGIKAIGRGAVLQRNVFLRGAVGFNFGQDAGQQDKTGRWQMMCHAEGNLVYGMGDLQADNQRLGWGCVLESCVASFSGNIFTTPLGVGDKTPAFRVNRVRDYEVNVAFDDTYPNIVVGHTHAFEVQGNQLEWGPAVFGDPDSLTLDNAVSPFASRNGGTIDDAAWDYEYADIPDISLDVDDIKAKARARQITAADVLAMARAQIGGK